MNNTKPQNRENADGKSRQVEQIVRAHEYGFNYFTVIEVEPLKDNIARLTLKNDYVLTNDTIIHICYQDLPKLGERIELKINAL